MLGIKWTFRRIVATIATFMGIGTLVSCYGVPTDDIYEADMYGMPANYDYKVDGQIEAIKTGKTNDNGYFEYKNIKTAGNYTLVFEDVDGEENGSFESKEKILTLPSTSDDNMNMQIKLEKK